MTLLTLQDKLAPALSPPDTADNPLTVSPLAGEDEAEVLEFLSARPIHTVFMAGFISDNGIVSPFNRGTFYGCRNDEGELEGVALIGHATLVEARCDEAMAAFARLARQDERARLIMGEESKIEKFWQHFSESGRTPRTVCRELLLEQRWPVDIFADMAALRPATLDDLGHVVSAHAALAYEEIGINPLETDPIGFRLRTARRIEQERVWVLIENGKLIFKADIVSDTPDVIYLEGVYVNPDERGKNYGSRCLMKMGRVLLSRAVSISLLVNEQNEAAIALYRKAGYQLRSYYNTIFLQEKQN
ncbi:MAG: GNAT family N-acetyltransferase [Pyrinomonadaceae bacterium]|nr:GNAT family N-acetyltransferase [Pyrinomonadaceae bacterium]